jgi:hypothetical protein
LRTLAGLELITSGDILVDGRRINDFPPQRRDMAMVFENYALYPHLKVFDNIAMLLVARNLRKPEVPDRGRRVEETLRITDHLNKRPGACPAANGKAWPSPTSAPFENPAEIGTTFEGASLVGARTTFVFGVERVPVRIPEIDREADRL